MYVRINSREPLGQFTLVFKPHLCVGNFFRQKSQPTFVERCKHFQRRSIVFQHCSRTHRIRSICGYKFNLALFKRDTNFFVTLATIRRKISSYVHVASANRFRERWQYLIWFSITDNDNTTGGFIKRLQRGEHVGTACFTSRGKCGICNKKWNDRPSRGC